MVTVLAPDGSSAVEIEALKAWEEDVSEEEHARRSEELDGGLTCFITFGSHEDATLGLGLYVHPRTAHQKWYRTLGDFDFVCDYLDVDAFNEGVRRASRLADHSAAGVLPSMVSSSRNKLNGWLPLYINSHHWARAKPFAAPAFLRLAGYRGSSGDFQPVMALDVCNRLLTCAVVGFLKGQSPLADSRTTERSVASHRSVQMYADVHRLLLQVTHEYPEIEHIATRRLLRFISDPWARTCSITPDLGDLIQCLLISDAVSWDDLAPTLIPEAMRRQAARGLRGQGQFDPWAESDEILDIHGLVTAWDVFAPRSCAVTFMCASFCKLVGRPHDLALEDVVLAYDKRWGRLGDEVVRDILRSCTELRCQDLSIRSFFPSLLPGAASQSFEEALRAGEQKDGSWESKEACQGGSESEAMRFLAECILWASWYDWNGDSEHVPAQVWPKVAGPHGLLEQWRSTRVAQPLSPGGRGRKRMQWRPRVGGDAARL